ncbi:MAG: hypothetical protein LBD14_01940 [Puniceicoccales bacterium]|jgi:hypothetical protein|nr:hypothetical protein [Puniceicoccales bacterium]
MNKHFDKLLLAFALVFFAAGVVCAFLLEKSQQEVPKVVASAPTGDYYEEISFPQPGILDEWRVPSHPQYPDESPDEPTLWNYDIFTPVEITWNRAGHAYVPKGVTHEDEPEFGLRLVSFAHPIYRLSLQGSVAPETQKADEKKTDDLEILIYDSEFKNQVRTPAGEIYETKGKLLRVRKGQELSSPNIKITDCQLATVDGADGTKTKNLTVTVFDNDLNREFLLTTRPYEFTDITNLVFALESDPGKTWTLHKVGDKIEAEGLGTFSIKSIDFERRHVSVEKLYKSVTRGKSKKTQTVTLRVESPKQPTIAPKSIETAAQS